ncbi:hypothetical protein [Pontibacter akesuensis]|uniref:Uncharacterized protein n=1 Tax=Pontibacter akesuensis TaxID=388950 RepID=A0A1I7JBP8_9BACT|nr:hypothetical protein [Pontibacter akesuensis]GHA71158.1 hypothetical protein GCM10007389_25770 [Pontibacter akesuensis]SFU82599.1 hypothetical protein SAMN04487941_2688 [Pontibacter akesuensis]
MKKLLSLSILFASALTLISCEKDDDFELPGVNTTTAYVSSNTSGMVTMLKVKDLLGIAVEQKNIASMDADGIYYNESRDEIILASRTTNRVEIYQKKGNGALEIKTTSTPDFTNPREIAVSGNMIVVVQDGDPAINNNMNRLHVYERTPSGVRYRNVYDVDFNLWGIHADGNTLYAVVDNTGDIVSFENFFANKSGMIQPSKRVTIEGLVRTHGITHSSEDNKMILTDIGDAASATDGALVVISNFSSVFGSTANGGMIGTANQIRISGANTMLGNPVDVGYDAESEHIYVAERANGGGKVLLFEMPKTNGNPAPEYSTGVAGASSVYVKD